ncbi:hypothetical protein D3C77_457720 [compost metagenome]
MTRRISFRHQLRNVRPGQLGKTIAEQLLRCRINGLDLPPLISDDNAISGSLENRVGNTRQLALGVGRELVKILSGHGRALTVEPVYQRVHLVRGMLQFTPQGGGAGSNIDVLLRNLRNGGDLSADVFSNMRLLLGSRGHLLGHLVDALHRDADTFKGILRGDHLVDPDMRFITALTGNVHCLVGRAVQ